MNRLFGQRKPANTQTLDECVSSLDARADSVSQKIDKLNGSLKEISEKMARLPNTSQAKQLLKKRAAVLLRQRKQYDLQLEQLRNQAFNLDQQKMAVDSVRDSKATVDAMKLGVREMRKQMKTVRINDIDRLQDELEDYIVEADEIKEALSRQYAGVSLDVDESELEAELELIANEMVLEGSGIEETNIREDDIAKAPLVPQKEPQSKEAAAKQQHQQIELDEFGLPVLPPHH